MEPIFSFKLSFAILRACGDFGLTNICCKLSGSEGWKLESFYTVITDRPIMATPKLETYLPCNEMCKSVIMLTPVVGTEIRGLQPPELDEAQKNDLTLLIA